MSAIWLAALAALVLLAVVAALLTHRLAAEIRATKARLDEFLGAATSVRDDVARTRAAVDGLAERLSLLSLKQLGFEKALGALFKWALKKYLPI